MKKSNHSVGDDLLEFQDQSHRPTGGKLSRRNDLLGARESLKETAAVPTRTLGAVGDCLDDLKVSCVKLSGGFKVDRLLKIVRRRMVSFSAPTLDDIVFG